MNRFRASLLFLVLVPGCAAEPPADSHARDTATPAAPATSQAAPRVLPAAGLALSDTADHWCAAFSADSLRPGQQITIVFPDSTQKAIGWAARLMGRRSSPCSAAFPQNSISELASYDLAMADSLRNPREIPIVGIAVVSEATWRRGADGIARADLNGDGQLEEARVCAIDEGQQFTLWTRDTTAAPLRQWWHGYYDWGALVDVTCTPDGD